MVSKKLKDWYSLRKYNFLKIFVVFLRQGFCLKTLTVLEFTNVDQAGFKLSIHLECWDERRAPPPPNIFFFFNTG